MISHRNVLIESRYTSCLLVCQGAESSACYKFIADFGRLSSAVTGAFLRPEQAVEKLSDYVMTAEAAEILGVSQNTLRAWAEDGKIPVHRNPANGYRLFRKTDLKKFLREVERSAKKMKKAK